MEKKVVQVKLSEKEARLLKAAAAFKGKLIPELAGELISKAIAEQKIFKK
jgi:hypothetical protein